MDAFGIRFCVNNALRFESLRALYAEIKRDKEAGRFRDPLQWVAFVPDDIKQKFTWPASQDRTHWLAIRNSTPIAVPDPPQQIGARGDFYRVFEAFEESEYDLLECEVVGDGIAEMQIDPHGYPYGGVGPLIALAEAFGFAVLGVNEYGKYRSRAELFGSSGGS